MPIAKPALSNRMVQPLAPSFQWDFNRAVSVPLIVYPPAPAFSTPFPVRPRLAQCMQVALRHRRDWIHTYLALSRGSFHAAQG